MDYKKEYEWKCLELEKAEEVLEKYVNFVKSQKVPSLKVVEFDPNAELPIRAHEWDAGADCKAVERTFLDRFGNAIDESKPENMLNAVQIVYNLGIGIEVPKGYMLMAACKSSVYKTGMDMANSVGVIDVDYQGNIRVTFNLNDHSRPYHTGDAVCQLILVPIQVPTFYWGKFEEETERGEGGHGSTGNLFKK